MTTAAVDRSRDWKVSTGYRTLLRIGWGALALACYGVVAALAIGVPGAWWMAACPAAVALLAVALLPEPVPAEWITGRRTRVDTPRDEE